MIQILKRMIESELERLISKESGTLYEAARYCVIAPAKRIRPLFVFFSTKLCLLEDSLLQNALHPACALEFIHTYSLIHDDLPCMDDDDFRRGQPTLHRVYGEGHAVLVGDFLLTFAFDVLANAPNLSAAQKISLIQILSKAAGAEGMVGGQILDIEGNKDTRTTNFLKTATLFQAAFLFGGVISNVSEESLLKLKSLGTEIGLLFQLADDLMDGEKIGNTWKNHYEKACNLLASFPGKNCELLSLIDTIAEPFFQATNYNR